MENLQHDHQGLLGGQQRQGSHLHDAEASEAGS